ncbi:MAG: tetratricopeptide repeat protein [Armatimonadetes bacterium]|nr:tetratricopeptide repeat protein [Armatimonadota bacterium]
MNYLAHVTAVLALFLAVASAASESLTSIASDMEVGQQLIDAGDYNGALQVFTGILDKHPGLAGKWSEAYGQVQFKTGLCYLALGNVAAAKDALATGLTAAKEGDPCLKNLRYWFGQAYVAGGESKAALDLFSNYVKDYPDEWIPRTIIWQCMCNEKKYEQALAYLQSVYDERPEMRPEVLSLRANTFFDYLNRKDDAINALHRLIADYPDHQLAIPARITIGEGMIEENRVQDARDWYTETLAVRPTDEISVLWKFRLAYCDYHEKNWATALGVFQILYTSYPVGKWHDHIKYLIGDCHLRLDNYAAARTAFKELISSFPDSSWAEAARRLLSDLPGQ